jgi:hypothetical protein
MNAKLNLMWSIRNCGTLTLAFLAPLGAQNTRTDLFEKTIRPVLATKCYACHSSKLKSPMGGLILDTKSGLQLGGASGPVLVPGKPNESRIIRALRYSDTNLQMPPTGKLPDATIADFEAWISAGAPDPREDSSPSSKAADSKPKGMSLEEGRKWWAFQPVHEIAPPAVSNSSWPRTKIDAFLLAKLEAKKLKPSPQADARTLVDRAYIDLVGFKPTYEEVQAFVADPSRNAYERLIDRLLASRQYGERWGRHWLDVARYSDDAIYAWRYRDWVVEALNQDVGYDRFVKLQLSADLMPGTPRQDLRALGFLGTAPAYFKEPRLSKDVIETFVSDDWDERVDAIGRGLLGITIACARCHDHKFDPITTKDYYGLAGVFASTSNGVRPTFEVEPQLETRFMWVEQRITELDHTARVLTESPGTNKNSDKKLAQMHAEIERLQAEIDGYKDRYPELAKRVAKYGTDMPKPRVNKPNPLGGIRRDPNEPFMNTVYEASQYVDGTDPNLTWWDYRPAQFQDLPIFLHGNPAARGEMVARHFPAVLSKETDASFHQGSGRLELAEKIFTDAAPTAARVIVNRVWGWHYGRPLVTTPSDFGSQGDKPSHPELLDDLAARFIEHGWSLKWLHREIMVSAAYQQSSQPRSYGDTADPTNSLLWRMNARRMEIEAYRDTILRAAGTLSDQMYGPPEDLESNKNKRRTVYARINRQRLNSVLKLYDFPDPLQTSAGRLLTTTSLQQLFVMNSSFLQAQAAALAQSVEAAPDNVTRIRSLYRKVLARDPDSFEMDLAISYLVQGTVTQYAQILLCTNEEIFWP